MKDPRLAAGMLVAFLVATLVGIAGIEVRAIFGGAAAVDEPQYLLSALSLYEDGNLDIADELAAERWRAFHDAALPVQTEPQEDGEQISPHDPLLAVLLAVPMGLGGFVAAKVAMAVLTGAAAALAVWIAVRRFGVPVLPSSAVVAVGFASPPLGVYAHQVYPEMAAGLAVLVGFAALTGRMSRAGALVFATAVVALPWLSVKYAPVAVVLAAAGLVRLWRLRGRLAAAALVGGLAAAGAAYLAVHQVIWGGWTVYASGDHFVASGEFAVVGENPDYAGRSERLTGLLVDRTWGIAAWQPGWLLLVPAVVALLVLRPRGWLPVVTVGAAGWLVATFVALTMAGYWSPGRQVVVVLPLLLVAIAWWLAGVGVPLRVVAAALGALGLMTMAALLLDGRAGELTWVTGFWDVDDPLYQARRALLVPYREGTGLDLWARHGAWLTLLGLITAATWRASRLRARTGAPPAAAHPSLPGRSVSPGPRRTRR